MWPFSKRRDPERNNYEGCNHYWEVVESAYKSQIVCDSKREPPPCRNDWKRDERRLVVKACLRCGEVIDEITPVKKQAIEMKKAEEERKAKARAIVDAYRNRMT